MKNNLSELENINENEHVKNQSQNKLLEHFKKNLVKS